MANSYNLHECSSKSVIAENGLYPSIYSIDEKSSHKEKDNDYDPFEHRDLEHPNSDVRSFANLLKSSLGSGILAMPAAFKNAGTVVGIVGTIVLGYICTHCVYTLVKVSQDVCRVVKSPSLGYAETVEAVFATGPRSLRPLSKASRIFIDLAMALTILGACSVYVILLAESVKQIIDNVYPDYAYIDITYYCLMFLIPVLGFTQIRNLKYLAPFSALANLLLILTFGICLYYICIDFPDIGERNASVDITRLPLFIGTVIFAMEGIGVVLPVENAMAKPQHFLSCAGVLNMTMLVVVVLYTLMGFLGFVRYGDDVKGSITLNLPTEMWPARVAKTFIVIAIFFTYTLQYYVPMEIVWRNMKGVIPKRRHEIAQVIMRAFFATLTVAVAAAFPRLEKVISLQGAFFYSFLGLVAPTVIEIIFLWERGLGKGRWIFYKDLLLSFFGMFVLVTGCIQSFRDIMDTFNKPEGMGSQ